MDFDLSKAFDYENGFYLTSSVQRVGKFANHLELFRRSSDLAGDIVECGVFKGASLSRFLKFRALFENPAHRKIYGFDTFGAFPPADDAMDEEKREEFISQAGDQSIPRQQLLSLFDKLGLNENLELVEGDIGKTIPAFCNNHPEIKISLLNIDVDMLEPTCVCLEHLYPRVVSGGVVILDDYGAFPGATMAADDYFKDKGVTIQKLPSAFSVPFIEKP
ncbi:MAG: TylF/MycF/NovP-related O-methyltransferase [Candidatus Latescibacteria bacterium]|jgi:hypothetical protein|nr:TylF/MycF/NovP-related O-methyltransferase [Candidatus Latescibacterota bacterium]|tara:strand:- start:1 stop:657 length:657 start_codon:yes stop_codon:yes gene_type:complete